MQPGLRRAFFYVIMQFQWVKMLFVDVLPLSYRLPCIIFANEHTFPDNIVSDNTVNLELHVLLGGIYQW